MRLAEIVDGRVVNVIEVGENRPGWTDGWPEAGAAGPGWAWDGQTFAPPVPEVIVPAAIRRDQFWAQAMIAGWISPAEAEAATLGVLPSSFDAALSSLSEVDAAQARIALRLRDEFRRTSPLVPLIQSAVGAARGQAVTDAEVDAFFVAAAALTA